MTDGGPEGSAAALRALRSANDEIDALSRGTLSPEGERRHILRVANAVDRSLRRLLRDDDRADLSLRLKALAPDELRIDTVLAELRRQNRLPVDIAAAAHDLFETRRTFEGGGLPRPGDGERAVRAAQGLEATLLRPSPLPAAPATPERGLPADEAAIDADLADYDTAAGVGGGGRRGWVLGGALGLVAAVALALYLLVPRGPDHMAEGIALFRSGAYADAAHHFFRHAQANPDDVTPHLYLARIHRRMNRPELAAEAIRQAQELAPEDPGVHRELGFLLLDTGRADVAVERFQRAVELDRASSEGWVGLIRALRESGRGEEAEAALTQAPAEVRALIASPGSS